MNRTTRSLFAGAVAAILLAAFLAACSSATKESVYDPNTGHPAGWAAPGYHGAEVKRLSRGFSICQSCHGADFAGGISSTSCFTCHGVNAPHAPAPWRGVVTLMTHTNTNTDNAPICALCHANGANSAVRPSLPAPTGTAPGCFNNTLCHGAAGHPAGWADPTRHGAAAKSSPASGAGFVSCETCHGTDFSGGSANTSCFTCHGVNAPHAPAPWRTSYSHTNTDTANAPACAPCHTNGANSTVLPQPPAPAGTAAGCFNNTLCHGAALHPAGWAEPAMHGASAELDFSACKTCHGAAYKGGSASVTCYQCHNGPGLNHPAPAWVVADHKAAAQTSIVACQKCHGSNYLGGGSHIACNSCHMQDQTKVHLLAWYPDVRTNHRAYALANGTSTCANQHCHGTNLTGVAQSGPSCATCHSWPFTGSTCGSCHGLPPAGSAFPDIAGRHAVHTVIGAYITCDACHTGAGSGTALHRNGIADVALAAIYKAKTGTATFNGTANTCANISCHGGQTTPDWLTGTINVNTQCTSCHESGTTQYNSYNSGRHTLHVGRNIACTVCHATGKLAVNHFTALNTSVMEGPASATTATAINYNGTSCNPRAGGLTGCHGSENWR